MNRILSLFRHQSLCRINSNFLSRTYYQEGDKNIDVSKKNRSPESPAMSKNEISALGQTIHAAHITEVHDVPFHVLIRPIPPVLDEDKVLSLMETLKDPNTISSVPPLDVLWIKGRKEGDYYYSFGGCHRYEAYKRLGFKTVPCKLVKSNMNDLEVYLGGSLPDLQ